LLAALKVILFGTSVEAEFLMSLKLWVNKQRQICHQKGKREQNKSCPEYDLKTFEA